MEVINRAFMPILPTKTCAISETNKYSFDLYVYITQFYTCLKSP